MFSPVDLYASLAKLANMQVENNMAPGSRDYLQTLLNNKAVSGDYLIEQSLNSTLSIIRGKWKYIETSNGPAINKDTNTKLGNSKSPQLYDLSADKGKKNYLADKYPGIMNELKELLKKEKKKN